MNVLDNLRVLRAAVAAEDSARLDLSTWRQPHGCNTLYCIGGLAASMRHFKAMGLTATPDGAPRLKDKTWSLDEALNTFFEPWPGAVADDSEDRERSSVAFDHLFAGHGSGDWDGELIDKITDSNAARGVTDKALALARLDKAISMWQAALGTPA